MILCSCCRVREAIHGYYCQPCLDNETKDLSNEELQAAEIIYNALGHKMTREQAEAHFAEARARLEREQRGNNG